MYLINQLNSKIFDMFHQRKFNSTLARWLSVFSLFPAIDCELQLCEMLFRICPRDIDSDPAEL